MSPKAFLGRVLESIVGPLRPTVKVTILAPEFTDFFESEVRPLLEVVATERHLATRRAALNGAWAVLFFGLLATSWEAALLWFLAA
jgi:hypothetical protein